MIEINPVSAIGYKPRQHGALQILYYYYYS